MRVRQIAQKECDQLRTVRVAKGRLQRVVELGGFLPAPRRPQQLQNVFLLEP